jgi:hypothetical protein
MIEAKMIFFLLSLLKAWPSLSRPLLFKAFPTSRSLQKASKNVLI